MFDYFYYFLAQNKLYPNFKKIYVVNRLGGKSGRLKKKTLYITHSCKSQ